MEWGMDEGETTRKTKAETLGSLIIQVHSIVFTSFVIRKMLQVLPILKTGKMWKSTQNIDW